MKNCLILGAGRSGTSMVAGSLRLAGYEMGAGLKPPTSSNPLGYFETVEINDINEDLLRPVVARWEGRPVSRWAIPHPRLEKDQHWLACLPPEVEVEPIAPLEARIRRAVARTPYCFKDPRFCYTLPVWRPWLAPDTVFVCVFRQPGRTIASMLRDAEEQPYLKSLGLNSCYAWQVWIHMYDRVVRQHRRQGRWLFLHSDSVVRGPGLRRLSRFLEAPVDSTFPKASLQRAPEIQPIPRAALILYWKMRLLSCLPA